MKARILSLGALFPMLAMTTLAMKTQEQKQQQQINSNSITKSAPSSERRNLIIGGEIAPPGRYPYFSTLEHYCGGALIAPDVILTAGHCKPSRHDGIQPHVGRYTYSHHVAAEENKDYHDEVFDIVSTKRHPDWLQLGDDEFVHDFSLLFLNGTYDRPYVRINSNDQVPTNGQEVVGMGVGFTSTDFDAGDSRSKTLREASLNYLDSVDCSRSHDPKDPHNNFHHRIHASHMCTTGGRHNQRDACAYDSGSPIIIPGESPQEDVLVALVSWGEGCADPNFPGVNARVSDAYDWIAETVCEHSEHAPPEFRCGGTDAPTMAPTASSSSSSGHTTTAPPTPMTQRFRSFINHLSVIVLFLAAFYVVLKLCRHCRSQDDDNDWILQKKWIDQNIAANAGDDDYDSTGVGGEKINLVCSSPMGESKASTGTSKTETSSDSNYNNNRVSYDAIDMDV